MMQRKLSRGNRFAGGEEVNPMDGVANLADVMLVLAVGIMLALVMAWNVDFTGSAETAAQAKEEVTVAEDYDQVWSSEDEATDDLADRGMTQYGTAYRDADGNVYILEDANPS